MKTATTINEVLSADTLAFREWFNNWPYGEAENRKTEVCNLLDWNAAKWRNKWLDRTKFSRAEKVLLNETYKTKIFNV